MTAKKRTRKKATPKVDPVQAIPEAVVGGLRDVTETPRQKTLHDLDLATPGTKHVTIGKANKGKYAETDFAKDGDGKKISIGGDFVVNLNGTEKRG